jgi:3-keto-5-aminohexanoate cleavage enzyme
VSIDPLIITVAPLGAEVAPEQTPHLYFKPADFAAMAERCAKAGAAIIHIHCRDDAGANLHAPERFAAVSAAIRERCDIVHQYSTGGSVEMSFEERAAPLALRPEMASLTCGSVNFGDDIFANPMPFMRLLARDMQKYNVVPELEIFDLGHLSNAKKLAAEGLIRTPAHVDSVLGVPGALEASIPNLVTLVSALPADWTWSVAGIGRAQLPLAVTAIAMGGHVRVGLEDNLYYERGRLATNEELVARIARIAAEMQRPVATPKEARMRLGIASA